MILALCVGLLSSSFAADLKPVGKAEISAQVDVPLYAGIEDWNNSAYVEVKVGEKVALLQLITGSSKVELTKAGAKALGVTFKGAEGKEKATVDFQLGTVKLSGVTTTLTSGPKPGEFGFDNADHAMPVMGYISLAGFAELAYAILPSEGVLRMVPAADGGKLVAALGGTPIEYTSQGDEKFHLGAGPKYEVPAIPYIVNVAWSGATLPTVLAFGGGTSLSLEVEQPPQYTMKDHAIPQITLPPAPSDRDGQFVDQWREAKVGELSGWVSVERRGWGPSALVEPNAWLGEELLANIDLAVDPVNHKLALRRSATLKLSDYRATYEAFLKKALEPTPPAAGAPTPSAEDLKKAKVAALRDLARWYSTLGAADYLPTAQQIVDTDPKLCSDWMRLAGAQMVNDHYQESLVAARKAAELYEPWMKLSTKERAEVQKDYDAAMKAKKDWTDPIPQDSSCFKAWSSEAGAMLMLGDYAGVAALYPSKLDIDYMLPLVAGNALLLQGKTEEAQAAYQQSIALLRTASPWARVGLVMTARSWEQAQAQSEGSRSGSVLWSTVGVRTYLATATRFGGPDAALKEADRLLANQPGNISLLLAKAALLKQQGKDNAAVLADAQKLVDREKTLSPRGSYTLSMAAQLLFLQGKTAEAKTQAELAVAADPNDAGALTILADIETALGDTAKAAEYQKRASNPTNPAYLPAPKSK